METGEACGPAGMEGELVHVSFPDVIDRHKFCHYSRHPPPHCEHQYHQNLTAISGLSDKKVFLFFCFLFLMFFLGRIFLQVGFTVNSTFYWQFTSCHQVLPLS